MINEDDVDIVKRLIAEHDNLHAFKKLVDFYSPRLCHFSFFYISSRESAEEKVSEVFFKIWKNRHKLTEINNLESYLFMAVKHHSLNFLKSKTSAQDFISLGDHPETLNFQTSPSPESSLISNELQEAIDSAITKLPPQSQLVFRMLKVQDFKQKQG